jgi:hypothetical protein
VPSCNFVLVLLPPQREAMASLQHHAHYFNDDAIDTGV